MRKVIVLGTGGTIASRGSDAVNAVASSSITELLAPLALDCEVEARDILTIGSYRIGFSEMRLIAEAALAAAMEEGVDGVVVTHGTDTMEETAYLTDLICDATLTSSPIVFTGAQFAADTIAPDGARNLLDAIAFAVHPGLRGSGAAIAFGGELRAARGVKKIQTVAPSPFSGGVLIARRRGQAVAVCAQPVRPEPALELSDDFDTCVVDSVMSAPGIDTALFEAAAERADAIVLVGTGVGNAGPNFTDAVAAAVSLGTPVVLSTRVPCGPVTPLYGNGGGVDLVHAGAIESSELGHAQSRVLLAALLSSADGAPQSVTELAEKFAHYAA